MARNAAPIRIFNRKVFIGHAPIPFTYKTEPIPVGDFQRLDIAYTVHGASPNLNISLSFEQAAQPETGNDENWASLGSSTSVNTETFVVNNSHGTTTQVSQSGFLPWVRGILTVQQVASSGTQNWAVEVSAMGHLHRDIV